MTNWTLDENRRCRARSSRHGEQCGQHAIKGGTVCRVHGGAAPQVKRSAQERIAEMVDPALVALGKLVEQADTDSVRLGAIKDILDRAGYKPQQRVDLTSNGQSLVKGVPEQALALLTDDR